MVWEYALLSPQRPDCSPPYTHTHTHTHTRTHAHAHTHTHRGARRRAKPSTVLRLEQWDPPLSPGPEEVPHSGVPFLKKIPFWCPGISGWAVPSEQGALGPDRNLHGPCLWSCFSSSWHSPILQCVHGVDQLPLGALDLVFMWLS